MYRGISDVESHHQFNQPTGLAWLQTRKEMIGNEPPFPLARTLQQSKVRSCILDGEMVKYDKKTRKIVSKGAIGSMYSGPNWIGHVCLQ